MTDKIIWIAGRSDWFGAESIRIPADHQPVRIERGPRVTVCAGPAAPLPAPPVEVVAER
jgi:hypothetical protein